MVAHVNKAESEAIAIRDAACLERRRVPRLRRWHTRALVAIARYLEAH